MACGHRTGGFGIRNHPTALTDLPQGGLSGGGTITNVVTVAERLSIYAKRLLRFVVVMAALIGVLATSVVLVGPQLSDLVSAHRSDHERLNLKPLAERSYIYDRNGARLGTMTNRNNPQNRSQVTLDKIPETVTATASASLR